jgi:release factor glutamine methyltransferase
MIEFTIRDVFKQQRSFLDSIDIELIIAHVIQKDRIYCLTHQEAPLTSEQYDHINALCTKRGSGYPLAYILKHKEFFGRSFTVSHYTLIPRQETEGIITCVINTINYHKVTDLLLCDIGTGSGIIPITLKKELEKNDLKTNVIATDISQKALSIAKYNAHKHNVNEIFFHQSNILSSAAVQKKIIKSQAKNIFITANLPYVNIDLQKSILKKVASQSLKFEPKIALWSQDNGTAHYKELISQIGTLTKSQKEGRKFYCFIEIDPKQKNDLHDLISKNFTLTHIQTHKDIAKKDRIIEWHF